MQPGPTIVHFTRADEFLSELELDRERIDRGIVRVTNTLRRSSGLPIDRVTVVAAFEINVPGSVGARLVRVHHICGDVMDGDNDSAALKRAREVSDKITNAAKAWGMDVRGGIIEHAAGGAL